MLTFMGMFENVLMEMYDTTDNSELVKQYGSMTGDNCIEIDNAFFARETSWKRNVKVYFDAPQLVVDNLRKLGVNVRKNHIPKSVANGKYGVKKHKYVIANLYWFWKFVEFGYRLGVNNGISMEMYRMRKKLRNGYNNDLFEINHIESENPIYEAMLLLAA
jgi:hypothetical protein